MKEVTIYLSPSSPHAALSLHIATGRPDPFNHISRLSLFALTNEFII